ncbi:hypothetical protein [Metallosphaera javensis (ex Sakai et al. 2022)]|uniref:hypothetical protein n=1 Tax=Metallosphaera javensis (ex Sakai et al. 2022) TaxID=2775498 RepID=UPI002585A9B2
MTWYSRNLSRSTWSEGLALVLLLNTSSWGSRSRPSTSSCSTPWKIPVGLHKNGVIPIEFVSSERRKDRIGQITTR